MKKIAVFALFSLVVLFTNQLGAKQDLIVDILNNPGRYINTQVTVVADILAINPNPVGTTRGTYTIMDDSCNRTIAVQTRDLPQVGRQMKITGTVMTDPAANNAPFIKEQERSTPGFMGDTKNLFLIGGGLLLLILIIIFVVLLSKPKDKSTVRPSQRPTPQTKGSTEPTKLFTPVPETRKPPVSEKTSLYSETAPNALISVEKGPAKGKEFTLYNPVTNIGRPGIRKNHIELNDETVSKTQASIYYNPASGEFSIKNESSSNPTLLNDQIINTSIPLKNGDAIKAGRTVMIFKKV